MRQADAVGTVLITDPMLMAQLYVQVQMVWTRILHCLKLPELFTTLGMYIMPDGTGVVLLHIFPVEFTILEAILKK